MAKKFKCNMVTPIEMGVTEIDGKRYYVLDDGTKLKSVTTILGEKLDKTSLNKWKARVGEEEANRISKIATTKGNMVHKLTEHYLLNEPLPFSSLEEKNAFTPIKTELDNHVNNIMGIELPVYSKYLKTAGRIDLVAFYDSKLSIIDFKTSKRIKKEKWIEGYFLQATAYSMMFESLYKIEIPQIVIIMTVDNVSVPQIFIKNRGLYVKRVLEIFSGKK